MIRCYYFIQNKIVVFNGYSNKPSTKDCSHLRRSGGTICVKDPFTSSMALQIKKEEFNYNKQNKKRFNVLLSQRLVQTGCEIHQEETLSKTLYWLRKIHICMGFSSLMQITSGIAYSSDLKLDGRVRRKINCETSLQCEPFLEVLSLPAF